MGIFDGHKTATFMPCADILQNRPSYTSKQSDKNKFNFMVLMSLLFEHYTNQVASNGFLLHTQIAATGDTNCESRTPSPLTQC